MLRQSFQNINNIDYEEKLLEINELSSITTFKKEVYNSVFFIPSDSLTNKLFLIYLVPYDKNDNFKSTFLFEFLITLE